MRNYIRVSVSRWEVLQVENHKLKVWMRGYYNVMSKSECYRVWRDYINGYNL